MKGVQDGIAKQDERITKMEISQPIAHSSKLYKFYLLFFKLFFFLQPVGIAIVAQEAIRVGKYFITNLILIYFFFSKL